MRNAAARHQKSRFRISSSCANRPGISSAACISTSLSLRKPPSLSAEVHDGDIPQESRSHKGADPSGTEVYSSQSRSAKNRPVVLVSFQALTDCLTPERSEIDPWICYKPSVPFLT